jgi:hypothetical protein
MKPMLTLSTLAVFLVAAPGRCLALWEIMTVSKEDAKKMGMEVRSQAAGPNDVRVELEFKAEGNLKDFSHVELRVGKGDRVVVTPLKEARSKQGRIVVSFTADRAKLDQIDLWVMVPEPLGGIAYEVRVKDFIEPAKKR